MTMDNLASELERQPFVPIRLHLVSGKIVGIRFSGAAVYFLENALLILRQKEPGNRAPDGYDVISVNNIERVESFGEQTTKKQA